MKALNVLKASGEVEPFSEEKLQQSLTRAGADNTLSRWITEKVREKIKDRTATSEIHDRAFGLLQKQKGPLAARYRLKQAIMELGPTGHPFEKLTAWILRAEGYEAETNLMIRGTCVTHEVDVVAKKEGRQIMVEAKYHNERGIKSDVKVAMYVHARFQDIKGVDRWDEAWLITNTKLTSEAREYARCVGLTAIAWNYPGERSLQNLIERSHLHPLTVLLSLDSWAKRTLLDKGLVLCKELNEGVLTSVGLKEKKARTVMEEVSVIMSI
ncbi:restriction endonuclease [Patescibacteria group bacterium]|nr:restriction endonuclease [Patescibacteria group bacterium]MCL5114819.1 restriction endonuclease [Patescibacteria group bacterium]